MLLGIASTAQAQWTERRVTIEARGGFNVPTFDISDAVDGGPSVGAGSRGAVRAQALAHGRRGPRLSLGRGPGGRRRGPRRERLPLRREARLRVAVRGAVAVVGDRQCRGRRPDVRRGRGGIQHLSRDQRRRQDRLSAESAGDAASEPAGGHRVRRTKRRWGPATPGCGPSRPASASGSSRQRQGPCRLPILGEPAGPFSYPDAAWHSPRPRLPCSPHASFPPRRSPRHYRLDHRLRRLAAHGGRCRRHLAPAPPPPKPKVWEPRPVVAPPDTTRKDSLAADTAAADSVSDSSAAKRDSLPPAPARAAPGPFVLSPADSARWPVQGPPSRSPARCCPSIASSPTTATRARRGWASWARSRPTRCSRGWKRWRWRGPRPTRSER